MQHNSRRRPRYGTGKLNQLEYLQVTVYSYHSYSVIALKLKQTQVTLSVEVFAAKGYQVLKATQIVDQIDRCNCSWG